MIFSRFSKLKIRDKIAWLSIGQFVVVIIVIGFILNIFISRLVNENIKNSLLDATQSRVNHIETYFEDNIQLLKLVTSRTALRKAFAHYNETGDEADIATMTNIIKDAISSVPDFERICLLGLDGKVLASTNEKYCGKDVATAKFFINGQKTEGVYFVEEDGVYKIYISGPMQLDGKLLGVGMTVVKLDDLEQIVRQRVGVGESGEVLVAFWGDDGERKYPFKRLFEEEAFDQTLESADTAYPMKQALVGKEEFFSSTLDYRNKEVIAASSFVKVANLGLVTKIDKEEALLANRELFWLFVLFFIIFIFIYYLLSKKVSQIVSQPIVELHHGTERIEQGDLNYKVGTDVQDEIGKLSRSFDNMVESLKKSRAEVDKKVELQTKEIQDKVREMDDQRKAIMNILEDVEEEKVKAEGLAGDLEKFKLAVDNASDHIVITDPEGIVLYGNKMVEKITGYTLGEALGKKAGSLWKKPMPEKYYKKLWQTIKINKKSFVGQVTNIKKNGEEYEASISISPVLNNSGKVIYFVGIERDITKEKEIDKAKTEFVSLASHQLRTPLSTINWYAEMLLNGDAGKLAPEQANYLQEIYRGNQRMVDLVNALLNVSRLELGTFVVEPKSVDITKIANIAIDELSPKIGERKIKFSKKYDKSVKLMKLDEKLTMIIFQNLLSNAVKYTPEKGSVNLEIKKNTRDIEIIVKDSGMGIPKSQQDKIFTKLFRADNVRETDTEGTGLGLYIIKQIVDHSGGKIWFKSTENKGTEFHVSIPKTGMKKKEGTRELGE